MKFLQTALLMLLLFTGFIACKQTVSEEENSEEITEEAEFYIGTYSRDNSKGIYKATIDGQGKFTEAQTVAQVNNPSFIRKTANGRFLLSVSETEKGAVLSFRIKGDSLYPVNTLPTYGAHPCHISILDNESAIVSNYTGGSIALYDISAEGKLTFSDSLNFKSKGPHPRQEASHAHSSFFMAPGRIATADLGSDNIYLSTTGNNPEEQRLTLSDSLSLEPGSGPRHLAFHPSGEYLYVINELSSTVTLFSKQNPEGKWSPVQTITTLPSDFKGENFCADIELDQTGNFLYASNRGHQSIAIYKVDTAHGTLTPIGHQDVFGAWPRNFEISPDNNFLVVANEHSGNLVGFKRNKADGTLVKTDELQLPAPVCIAF